MLAGSPPECRNPAAPRATPDLFATRAVTVLRGWNDPIELDLSLLRPIFSHIKKLAFESLHRLNSPAQDVTHPLRGRLQSSLCFVF